MQDAAPEGGVQVGGVLQSFEHPITCENITYSAEPIAISLKDANAGQIKQIGAGDYHCVVLTVPGAVYTWGLAQKG